VDHDKARSGPSATDGPAARLSRAEIAAAAIGIADREGIDAVTMRRVAAALGSGTMSLYRHVSGRQVLLDAMLDAVYSQIELPALPSGEWRQDVALLARAQRGLMRSHPWVAPLIGGRPPLLPSFLRTFEFSLRAFEGAGLGITEAAAAGATVAAFVTGFALLEHAEDAAHRRTGLTKEQWRLQNWSVVERILAGGAYPAVARFVEQARDADPDATFESALGQLLDGVQQSLPRVTRPARPRRIADDPPERRLPIARDRTAAQTTRGFSAEAAGEIPHRTG
jgi:AcrR family transcriptional regulator